MAGNIDDYVKVNLKREEQQKKYRENAKKKREEKKSEEIKENSGDVVEKKEQKKKKRIPASIFNFLSPYERAIYEKTEKDLTEVEAEQLIDINIRVAKYKSRLLVQKIANNPERKLVSFGKCIFAENYLAADEGKNYLKELLKEKKFSEKEMIALNALAKKYNLKPETNQEQSA